MSHDIKLNVTVTVADNSAETLAMFTKLVVGALEDSLELGAITTSCPNAVEYHCGPAIAWDYGRFYTCYGATLKIATKHRELHYMGVDRAKIDELVDYIRNLGTIDEFYNEHIKFKYTLAAV
jgi:hypothetical protein